MILGQGMNKLNVRLILLSLMIFSTYVNADTEPHNADIESNWWRVQLKIGELVSLHDNFQSSFCTFVQEQCFTHNGDYLLVNKNLNDSVQGGKVVHIKGDLNTDIVIGEHSELVIGGDVSHESTIYSEGISKVFVGGNFYGKIESRRSSSIYVMGDFKGTLYTGAPSTHLVVKKDFEGIIIPNLGSGAILTVDVKGYASREFIESFYNLDYTKVNGYFGSSDMPTGVYRFNNHNLTISQL